MGRSRMGMNMRRTTFTALCLFLPLMLFARPDGSQNITAEIKDNKIIVTYHIPEGMHQMVLKDYFKFDVAPVKGVEVGEIVYPGNVIKGKYGDKYSGETKLVRPFTVTGQPAAKTLNITASYQLCDDVGTCFMPQQKKLIIPLPAALTTGHKEKIIKENTTPPVLYADNEEDASSLLYMFLLAFLGGVMLNLMPCVLPVLSIKMMSIVKSAHMERKEIMMGGWIYTAGVLFSFMILAFIVIFLKKSGESVGWGFQFQNPYFVFSLMVVIWAFAFSLFEIFIIRMPGMKMASEASSAHGVAGTFMSGVFAVLLATPCTAPMLGSAIGFALKQSSSVIFLMMILIGFGLAFPFILLGFFPNIMKVIPKPGNWMNVFSGIMGFLLLGTAVFLARTLSFIIPVKSFINMLWFMLFFSFALWIYGLTSQPHISKRKQWFGMILSLGIIFTGGFYLLDFSGDMPGNTKISDTGRWQKFSPELLRKLQDEKRCVFVDFYAEWCMTCKTNETLVLHTEEIMKAFGEHDVALLAGDFTKKSPLILEWLQKYEKGGVPLYLLFKPGKKKPVVFPEILTKKMILNALAECDAGKETK